jgi:predicted XRE-type DNA-binding protein
VRRSNADKQKAAKAALLHPKGAGLSDSQIAEHVGVSQPSVGKYRKELEEEGALIKFISRTGLDGRTTDTSNIGGASAGSAPLPAAGLDFPIRKSEADLLKFFSATAIGMTVLQIG